MFRTLNNYLSSTLSHLSLSYLFLTSRSHISFSPLALALTSRSRISLSPLALASRSSLSILSGEIGVKLISKLLCGCAFRPRPPVSLRLPNSCVVVWIAWICHVQNSPTYLYLSSLFVFFLLPLLAILLYGCLLRIFSIANFLTIVCISAQHCLAFPFHNS